MTFLILILVNEGDGNIYAYSTQARYTLNGITDQHYIPTLRSKDLVNWQYAGDAF